jgi:hypothetical protein
LELKFLSKRLVALSWDFKRVSFILFISLISKFVADMTGLAKVEIEGEKEPFQTLSSREVCIK